MSAGAGWLVGLAIILAACSKSAPAPAKEGPPLLLEVSGCAATTETAACEIGDGARLRIFVEAPPDARLEVGIGDRTIASHVVDAPPGRRIELDVPPRTGAAPIVVTATLADGTTRRGELGTTSPEAIAPAVVEATRRRRAGDTRGAREVLAPVIDGLPSRQRAAAEGLLARADLAEGKTESALVGFDRAMKHRREAHDASGLVTDACALARAFLYQARRPLEARATLASLGTAADVSPDAATDVDFTAGMIAYETGDLHAALERFDRARRRAERLGQVALLARVDQVSAEPLQDLGQIDLAAARLESARALVDDDPCERARVLTNIGWFELQRGDAVAATPRLEAALAAYRSACPRPVNEQNVLVNLALAALGRGEIELAERHLAQANAAGKLESRLAAWALEIEARIATRRDPRKAAELWARLSRTAEAGVLPDARWRAKVGAGETATLLGQHEVAIAAFREAEAILDERTQLVPTSAGRDGFLAGKDRAARLLVELLVERGRIPEALAVGRRSRARALASVMWSSRVGGLPEATRQRWEAALDAYWTEREALAREAEHDWEKSAEALAAARASRKERADAVARRLDDAIRILGPVSAPPAPEIAPGEVVLFASPGARGLVTIAANRDRAIARTAPPVDADAPANVLAAILLDPFEALLGDARRITVLASGPAGRVDVHALPFRDRPLIEHADVVYGLDVPRSAASVARGGALVISDTLGDLPAARREGAFVTDALAGEHPVSLAGPALTHDRLRRELENAGYLHFAGHGAFAQRALESAFPLGDGSSFSVADVLALPRAPSAIVLTACESARTASRSSVEGLGLAQAFVVAGADTVIAATRPVADADAEVFVRALYASRGSPDALRTALATLRRERPEADWSSFRKLVR